MSLDSAWTHQSRQPQKGGRWRLIERAVAYTSLWGALGAMVPLSIYISKVLPLLDPIESKRWLVQIITFLVATTVCCTAAVAAGVCCARALKLPAAAEVAFAILGGAVSAPLFGAMGVGYFGRLPLPYVGGSLLVVTSSCTLLLVAAAYARSERPQPSWPRVLLAALVPTVPIALLGGGAALLFPNMSLDLDAMRQLAEQVGIAKLGALIGLPVGVAGGFWLAVTSLLARRGTNNLPSERRLPDDTP